MKKILIALMLAFVLVGCEFSFGTTTTEKNLAQLSEEDLANIKDQIMNQIRQEILDEYHNELSDVENMIINVVKANAEAVVGVSNFARRNGVLIEQSSGSGVIYKQDFDTNTFYVITNEHVVDKMDKLQVVLSDKSYIDAELVGKDAQTDLAVIKFVSSKALPVAVLGDSDKLQVGQFAIAVGNPLGYDYYGSVTLGIVSGLARNIDIDYNDDNVIDWVASLIQHDAAISPGNSGGALFDLSGKLIGINNMKIVQSTVSDIGFAIPVNTVKKIVNILEEYGTVERPSLGVTGLDVSAVIYNNSLIEAGHATGEIIELPEGVTKGFYVSSVHPQGSGYGYLEVGDVIIRINDTEIGDSDDLRPILYDMLVGDIVTVQVNRSGEVKSFTFALKKRPE